MHNSGPKTHKHRRACSLFTRARDVQTGLPGESEWRGSRLAQQRERCALHLFCLNGGRPTSSHVNQKEKYILKASQSTVQRRVLSTKGQSCLSAAELVMGHPRNPTAYYLASTLLAYRRLRPKSVHTCFCRCEHKGFAVTTQLLRLHLPVKCEQRILNQRSPGTILLWPKVCPGCQGHDPGVNTTN